MTTVDEIIDRLLHDAQHADAAVEFAGRIGHFSVAKEKRVKRDTLIEQARTIHAENSGSRWPHAEDCKWAPEHGEIEP